MAAAPRPRATRADSPPLPSGPSDAARVADAFPTPGSSPTRLVPFALAFSVGVGAFYLLPAMPTPRPGWALAGLALILALLRRPPFARVLAVLILGALWSMLDAGALKWSPLPDALTRAPLLVEGRITSVPADAGFARRFLFEVERAWTDPGPGHPGAALEPSGFRGLVRLSWYQPGPGLRAGERWRLPVRLKPSHGLSNPGGFDYERWLFEQGIKATGNLRKGAPPVLLDPGPGPQWLNRVRQEFAEHLGRVLGDAPALGLIQALTIGDRSGFEPSDWELLTRTGTNHLVAISGLHVGLIATVAFFLVRWLWARQPWLALALAAPRAGALAAMAAALAYAALAGFAVSTQRALIMLAVVLGALLWERTLRPWHALSLALAGVLVVDPGAVLSYGAWLSFGAVTVLLFNLGGRLPGGGLWDRWGRAQWAVGLGLLPLLLALFGRASLIAPLVNLVAVPLFGLLLPLVLGASLLSLVPGLDLPLIWTAGLLDGCLRGLERVAAWPWAAATLSARPLWAWGAAGLGVALLLAPRGLPGRWLGLLMLLPLLVLRPAAPAPGEAWLTLLDVGQGLATVVRTSDRTLVFDSGPGFGSGFNVGSTVLVPFLRAQGIERVDLLLLSHADRDHTGGAAGLMERIPVGRILSGEPQALGIAGAEACRAGQTWDWSGVRFRLLHPNGTGESGNDASCVLRVEAGGRSVLLTGDITQAMERRLTQDRPQELPSDVLVAGHHGSATSTSRTFLDAVAPRLVLYAAGYGNPFGFPARAVRERVEASGIAALNTGTQGAVELRLGPDGDIRGPWTWREHAGRLWTHRADEAPPPVRRPAADGPD